MLILTALYWVYLGPYILPIYIPFVRYAYDKKCDCEEFNLFFVAFLGFLFWCVGPGPYLLSFETTVYLGSLKRGIILFTILLHLYVLLNKNYNFRNHLYVILNKSYNIREYKEKSMSVYEEDLSFDENLFSFNLIGQELNVPARSLIPEYGEELLI